MFANGACLDDDVITETATLRLGISRLEITHAGLPTQSTAKKKEHTRRHVNFPFVLPDFNQNWNSKTNISETPPYQIS
jgi:hypothetical protein